MLAACKSPPSTPVAWRVPSDGYGRFSSWGCPTMDNQGRKDATFQIKRDWLLPREDGNRVLVIEADSSVGEQALALSHESANDLSLAEASQGFRVVSQLAEAQGALTSDDVVARVLLADSNARFSTGGGTSYTLRERATAFNDCDVLIDARLPLLHAVLQWAEQVLRHKANTEGHTAG
mmetsp:Transcript_35047/g.75824  ORF Transcript_35047/g.75824 Transcript_35047/m.75824 type:complete len:178 (-) Transcript_35047:9-542(-)